MMEPKNVVNVQIFGHAYTIRSEADEKHVLDVAAYVDQKMREITEKLPVAPLTKVAILASLNIADELFKERATHQTRDHKMNEQQVARVHALNAVLDEVLQDGSR
jgi:cell division protein ZapA